MKRYLKTAVICFLILYTAAVFCGCKGQEEESAAPEISYVSSSDELKEDLKDIVAQYLTAVTRQDHNNVVRISTEEFEYNFNETAFFDYARTIEHFELTDIDMTRLLVEDDIYTVPVICVLTVNETSTDENGNGQHQLEYCYSFSFRKTDDGYRIKAVSESAFG